MDLAAEFLSIESAHLKYEVLGCRQDLLNGLTGLAADVFTNVADAFAFVWLGWVVVAHFGGELADELLVDSFHLNLRIVSDSNGETFRDGMEDGMGFTEAEVEVVAFDGRTKTNTLDLKILNKAFADTYDEVINEAAESAVESAHVAQLISTNNGDLLLAHLNGETFGKIEGKFALWSFDTDLVAINFDGDLIDCRDGLESYS